MTTINKHLQRPISFKTTTKMHHHNEHFCITVFELVREVVYPLNIEGRFGVCELAGGTHTNAEKVW